jgi:phospholipid N-methyltransferase
MERGDLKEDGAKQRIFEHEIRHIKLFISTGKIIGDRVPSSKDQYNENT